MIRGCLIVLLLMGQAVPADEPHDPATPFLVETRLPRLRIPSRPWTDATGTKAIVGSLIGRRDGKFVIERADGKTFRVQGFQLSTKDRVFARQATEPRVDPNAHVFLGTIVKVMDGDTIKVEAITGDTFNVRLNGIDAPEKKQQGGQDAIAWLDRIKKYRVRIEFTEQDRYGRVLGDAYIGNRWVNYEIALAGWAWSYDKYSDDERLRAAVRYAKRNRRGIWASPKRIAPWDWRNGVREATAEPLNVTSIRDGDTVVFVTESGTHYHTEGCRHAKGATKIPLSRATSAYEPCKVCHPPE